MRNHNSELTSSVLEINNAPSNSMEQLLKYKETFKKSPDSITFALRNNPRTKQSVSCIAGLSYYESVSRKHPIENNPTSLSEEPNTREVQSIIYKELWIDVNTNANLPAKKFLKWAIDWLIVGNLELVMNIKEKWVLNFLALIKDQLTSVEGWKKIASSLWKTVTELFSGDAYKTWKSVAELWLITTWSWALWWWFKKIWKEAIMLSWKIGTKTVIKEWISSSIYMTWRTLEWAGSALQIPTKAAWKVTEIAWKSIKKLSNKVWLTVAVWSVVEGSKEVLSKSEIVKSVKWKVADIIEERQLRRAGRLELEWKLIDSSKLDLQFYDTPEKLSWLKQRLWLSESATIDEVEQMYRLKLHETMMRYEVLWKDNLSRVSRGLIYEMRKSWEKNPQQVILDEIKSVNEAFKRWDIKIVRVDEISKWNIDIRSEIIKDWFKSPYQINNNTWTDIWMNSYWKMREWVYRDMGIYGLDPKYWTFLVNKKELGDLIKKYWKDNPMISVLDINQLQSKAWVTMHDTLLYARTSIAWVDQYMFGIEDLLNVRALKNLENKYNEQYKQLLSSAEQNAKAKWERRMYEWMSKESNFMEVQIFWQLGPPKEHHIWTSIDTIFSK